MNRLLISAAHKSSGKTTVSVGLAATLRARNLTVQPFKKGPDYIDPMWLSAAAGRDCHNLDFFPMSEEEIRAVFFAQSQGADLSLIEGNKGLYDGLSLDGSNSNAALARLLAAPIVLVIDARGMTRGIAPLILGYQAFEQGIRIAGVILNQLGGSRHEGKLRAVIEHYTDVPVLGALHYAEQIALTERHLGLIPSNETAEARAKIDQIAARVADGVDIERLLALAAAAAPLTMPVATLTPTPPPKGEGAVVRLGIARDAAFGFYYPGDLEALQRAGAELLFFDSLRDSRLPAVDGLFIGGGFPETQMKALSANRALRSQIHQAVENDLPVYAECGGLMYLSRSIAWKDTRCEMVGAIAADTVMHARPQGRGYVVLRETGEGLWPRGPAGSEVRAHEFHYSSLVNIDPSLRFAYEVVRGNGVDGKHDGIVHRNVLACYTHMRHLVANPWADRFVAFVRKCKKTAASDNLQAVRK